jgi:hypothetical protein
VSVALRLEDELPLAGPPLVCAWDAAARPLPVRPIRDPRPAKKAPLGVEAPPWHSSGPTNVAFDFCGHVRRLCADLVVRTESLRHVNVSRILFAVTQARTARPFGLQARVTPLRFRDGHLVRRRGDTEYQVQRYFVNGREVLYLMTFCLPRFLNQDFDDKLVTLFHELYHISPQFNGDLRRHGGRYDIHSHSKRGYDAHMADLARQYLDGRPDARLHGFLRLTFAQLHHRHGGVVGVVVPRPRLIPV